MQGTIAAVETSLEQHARGRAVFPAKITMDLQSLGVPSWINAMPAYVESVNMAGIKWVGGFAANRSASALPYIRGTIILNEPNTGHPVAVMDGTHITSMRTGAAAAIGAKYLAKEGASVAAIVGAGTQGRASLIALQHVFDVREARVYDISPEASTRFCSDLEQGCHFPIHIAGGVREAVEGAHVIVTATLSYEPIVLKDWVAPGASISALGSGQELEDSLLLEVDKLVVDDWEQNKHRGQLRSLVERGHIRDDDISAELGEIVAGLKPGREHEEQRCVACLIGMAVEDIAVAAEVYGRAREMGLGQKVQLA
jgi:alanine dehydrogenase